MKHQARLQRLEQSAAMGEIDSKLAEDIRRECPDKYTEMMKLPKDKQLNYAMEVVAEWMAEHM